MDTSRRATTAATDDHDITAEDTKRGRIIVATKVDSNSEDVCVCVCVCVCVRVVGVDDTVVVVVVVVVDVHVVAAG